MIAVQIAKYLRGVDAVEFNYDEESDDANVFIQTMPADPIDAVSIFEAPRGEPDVKLGYDYAGFHIIVRAEGDDPRVAYAKARRIYEELHGLHHIDLDDGTYLVGCNARQSGPVSMASDPNGNYEYSVNFDCETRSLTAHRE